MNPSMLDLHAAEVWLSQQSWPSPLESPSPHPLNTTSEEGEVTPSTSNTPMNLPLSQNELDLGELTPTH
jgi:hypothetical protein